jgi:hypothetical protein
MRLIDLMKRRNSHALGLVFLSSLLAVGCHHNSERQTSKSQCEYEPVGDVSVWVDDVDAFQQLSFSGTVESIVQEDQQPHRLSIMEETGKQWSIRYRVPGMALPIEIGQHYEFEVQHVGGWPSASSVFVWDRDGLLFVGVSDWDVGSNVAKSGIPGFEIEKVSSDCESRPHSRCYDELKNAVLKASARKESVVLFHGESARLGSYDVTCLTCQDVVYNSSCADAGLIGVSYTIVRRQPEPPR